MDFAQTIEFEESVTPKLVESKKGLLHIKEEKIDPTINLSSGGKEIVRMDIDPTIEFEENVKPKEESKEGFLHINQEKNDPTEGKLVSKHLSNDGKEIVEMDFDQKIEFEEHTQPKLECKEEFLQIKEEKINPKKDKLEFLASVAKKNPQHWKRKCQNGF